MSRRKKPTRPTNGEAAIPDTTAPLKLVYGVTLGRSALALMRGQLQWFSSRDWRVTLVCTPDPEAALTVEREKVAFYGIPMEREIAPISDIRSLWNWVLFLRSVRPYAFNVGTPKAGLLGGAAAWLTRVPKRIYVVRGLRLSGSKGIIVPVLWIMERLSSAFATDVVVVSRSLANELIRLKLVSARKSWIIGNGSSNGVDAPTIAARAHEADQVELRREIDVPQDALIVGFIGRISKDKGLSTLIDVFCSEALSKDIHLVIIGAAQEPELVDEIHKLGDRVRVLPWTSDLWGKLPILDVLCLPTRREGFPNVVLEAASAGIPTVTTRATGAVDSVVHGETGFIVDVDDSAAMVGALNQYAADRTLVQRQGAAAKARAHHEFSPEEIWLGLEALLKSDYGAHAVTRLDRLRGPSPSVTSRA